MESLRVRAQRFEGGKKKGVRAYRRRVDLQATKRSKTERNPAASPRLASLPLPRARESRVLASSPAATAAAPHRTGGLCLGLERGNGDWGF